MNTRDLFDLTGKAAIVTGGGTGIGRQLAQGLAELGADVVLCARKADRCERAAAELRGELGVRALGLACDVRDPVSVEAVVERTVAELGRVDILVNNAGTTWGAPPEDLPLDAWRKVIDVNLTGVFLFAQAVGRRMIEQGPGGRIVNIASIAGLVGQPAEHADSVVYHASKGGVIALTRDLAVKWARHGIGVNAIAPGWFPTDMATHSLGLHADGMKARIPLGRIAGADEIASAVAFLAGDGARYVNGAELVCDGGMILNGSVGHARD